MAGSTTKTTTKKSAATTSAEKAPAPVAEEKPDTSGELAAAQKEIATLKGQLAALTPEPEPEPEPLTTEQRIDLLERQLSAVVSVLKTCFSPTGMPAKVNQYLSDRMPRQIFDKNLASIKVVVLRSSLQLDQGVI